MAVRGQPQKLFLLGVFQVLFETWSLIGLKICRSAQISCLSVSKKQPVSAFHFAVTGMASTSHSTWPLAWVLGSKLRPSCVKVITDEQSLLHTPSLAKFDWLVGKRCWGLERKQVTVSTCSNNHCFSLAFRCCEQALNLTANSYGSIHFSQLKKLRLREVGGHVQPLKVEPEITCLPSSKHKTPTYLKAIKEDSIRISSSSHGCLKIKKKKTRL